MSLELRPDQAAAKAVLAPLFDSASDARVGVLKGFAGTGKTVLVAHLIGEVIDQGWNVKTLTPTGRASEVLGKTIEKLIPDSEARKRIQPRTIHSFIYKVKPMDFTASQLSLFADVKAQEWDDGPTLWIVDESSMIGNQVYEENAEPGNMRFGSGSLLKDLLDSADLEGNDGLRILFVGDPGQLPPIGVKGEGCPALTPSDIADMLPGPLQSIPIPAAELNEVKRQNEGSLLSFVTEVRMAMDAGDTLPADARESVRPLDFEELVEKYVALTDGGAKSARAVILTHTNKRVQQFNQQIRKALGRDHRLLHMDDVLLVKRNQRWYDFGELEIGFEGISLRNGTFIQVMSVPQKDRAVEVNIKGEDEPVALEFWNARVKTLQADQPLELDVKILASRLRPSTSDRLEQALLVDLQRRLQTRYNLTPKSPGQDGYEEYQRRVARDPYFNALRVQYGYAVTVHNAQGGEWPAVIVDPSSNNAREWQHHPEYRREYARWVYTAVTRAKEEVWCLRPEV